MKGLSKKKDDDEDDYELLKQNQRAIQKLPLVSLHHPLFICTLNIAGMLVLFTLKKIQQN